MRIKTLFMLFCVVGSYLPLSVFLLGMYYWRRLRLEDTESTLVFLLKATFVPFWWWAVTLVLSICALIMIVRNRTWAGYWRQGVIGLSGIALVSSLIWFCLLMFLLFVFPQI